MRTTERLERLRAFLREADLDVFLVESEPNRQYLTGFTGSAGVALATATNLWLAVDFRYWQQAERQCPDCNVVRMPPMTRFETTLQDLVQQQEWRRIGIEAEHVTVDTYDRWCQVLAEMPTSLVKTAGLVERLRQVKTTEELERIQRAIALTDEAMEYAAGLLRPGISEAALAWRLEVFYRTHGAETLAFPTIVSFGPNSALPHHHPGERTLNPSDPVVIDMGAKVDGYCADLTRSFCLAPADGRFAELYAIVREALETAERDIHAGLLGREADAVAREVIAAAGYGDFFGHGLGHSLGLEIHEPPTLSRLNDQPLLVGTVETIEPGIYLPDWGGIRIEDIVVLKEAGTQVLTGAAR